jgi:hypothetical protein
LAGKFRPLPRFGGRTQARDNNSQFNSQLPIRRGEPSKPGSSPSIKAYGHLCETLANLDTAIELLSLPDRIRGYGPVKEKAVQDSKVRYAQLAADLVSPPPAPRQIAAE